MMSFSHESQFDSDIQVDAIDPVDCGCLECEVGEYVPFDNATADQIISMIRGDIANHTDYETVEEVLDNLGKVYGLYDEGRNKVYRFVRENYPAQWADYAEDKAWLES